MSERRLLFAHTGRTWSSPPVSAGTARGTRDPGPREVWAPGPGCTVRAGPGCDSTDTPAGRRICKWPRPSRWRHGRGNRMHSKFNFVRVYVHPGNEIELPALEWKAGSPGLEDCRLPEMTYIDVETLTCRVFLTREAWFRQLKPCLLFQSEI